MAGRGRRHAADAPEPAQPLFDTPLGRSVAAAAELFERTTRRYGKPEFGITSTEVDGKRVAVVGRDRLAKAVLLAAALPARPAEGPRAPIQSS